MCQNKIRKKTLVEKLKFWILGLILLFVAVIIVPRVTYDNYGSRVDLSCVEMRGIAGALNMFNLDNGNYPLTKEGLNALIKNPNPKKYPNYNDSTSKYMEIIPRDSWKNLYIYIHYQTKKGDAFQLISFGADGKYGGEGMNEDIVYPSCHEEKKGFF